MSRGKINLMLTIAFLSRRLIELRMILRCRRCGLIRAGSACGSPEFLSDGLRVLKPYPAPARSSEAIRLAATLPRAVPYRSVNVGPRAIRRMPARTLSSPLPCACTLFRCFPTPLHWSETRHTGRRTSMDGAIDLVPLPRECTLRGMTPHYCYRGEFASFR